MSTPTPAQLIAATQLIAEARTHGTMFGDRKVFLSTVPGLDLQDAECLAWLEGMRHCGALQFARADLVAAMDPALVKASTWSSALPYNMGTTEYHFLVLE